MHNGLWPISGHLLYQLIMSEEKGFQFSISCKCGVHDYESQILKFFLHEYRKLSYKKGN